MRLQVVELKSQKITPPHTNPTYLFEAGTPDAYEITKEGDTVVIWAPGWTRALVVPWSEVSYSHASLEDVTGGSKPQSAAKK